LVERNLAKVEVESSRLFSRSRCQFVFWLGGQRNANSVTGDFEFAINGIDSLSQLQ
jgi:hypothetical protein